MAISLIRSQSLSEEDEALEQLFVSKGGPPGGSSTPADREGKETIVKTEVCTAVSFMECVEGHFEITTQNIYFYSDPSQKKEGHTCEFIGYHGDVNIFCDAVVGMDVEFKVRLDQLREIHSRRYNMQRTALELFLTDQSNYFLNFSSSKVSVSMPGRV